MRTKTILLSAAVLAAGIAASMAQSVYSINAVGYVNLTILSGYNLISNPLNGTNNSINTIMPTCPDGSVVLRWNNASQGFYQAETYLGGVWYDSTFVNPSTTVINPGEGFFFQNNGSSATLTFVGEVPQGNLTNRVSANYGFLASQVPQSGTLTSLGFPGQDGMTYNGWNAGSQGYNQAYTFLGGLWYEPGFANAADPVPAVGEGFLITNPGSAVNWTRTFSVNN